ncbi:hypothetical protein NA56DRAFT_717860 [Hyaloscypha hepaticicola]|uniref:PiggyBac transposable element-derived protein domain-containing protein n=1 Tax=Hyaloscypha hepaticicola TaxID=2082293 RepID=A0A2J6Q9D4_9HELO|nr:hypothetical protein NA56DRAFT_717860 [Hyaloscypha hepaticicola]
MTTNLPEDCEIDNPISFFEIFFNEDKYLQTCFQEVVVPGSQVSYDEIMIPFRGRSVHCTKVPGKPDPNGYKIWALADKGYLYNWLYFSGTADLALVQEGFVITGGATSGVEGPGRPWNGRS